MNRYRGNNGRGADYLLPVFRDRNPGGAEYPGPNRTFGGLGNADVDVSSEANLSATGTRAAPSCAMTSGNSLPCTALHYVAVRQYIVRYHARKVYCVRL